MMVQTWPAARNAWTWFCGACRMASIAGCTRTCAANSEKLEICRLAACKTASAVAGAVVSNPTANKTTSCAGCSAANGPRRVVNK